MVNSYDTATTECPWIDIHNSFFRLNMFFLLLLSVSLARDCFRMRFLINWTKIINSMRFYIS